MRYWLFFLCGSVMAADDPQVQIQALQAALTQSQMQTNQCNVGQINMAVELDALRRKIQMLEESAKKKDPPK